MVIESGDECTARTLREGARRARLEDWEAIDKRQEIAPLWMLCVLRRAREGARVNGQV